jgi:hypothetical protein
MLPVIRPSQFLDLAHAFSLVCARNPDRIVIWCSVLAWLG